MKNTGENLKKILKTSILKKNYSEFNVIKKLQNRTLVAQLTFNYEKHNIYFYRLSVMYHSNNKALSPPPPMTSRKCVFSEEKATLGF